MEALPLTATNPGQLLPRDAAAGGGPALPGADAAEIGAFVAALLAQTQFNVSDAAAPATGALPVDGNAAEAGAELPVVGQTFAGALPLLPQAVAGDGETQGAPVMAAAVAVVGTEGSAAPRPLRPLAVGSESRAAATPAVTPGEAEALPVAATGEAEVEVPLPAVRAPVQDVVATQVAAREVAAATQALPGAEAAAAAGVTRNADLPQVTEAYAGKPTTLPMAEPEVFTERLNQQVAVMVSQNSQHARIAVSPPELGPVEVRVRVVGDEATIQLAAPHAATRDALEDALPRLRAAFAGSGIELGDAGVYEHMPERHSAQTSGDDAPRGDDGWSASGDEAEAQLAQPLRRVHIGLIDAFA